MEHALFENYEHFITEHNDEISNPAGALKMITDNGMFRAYMDSLTEGLDPKVRTSVLGVANRQREMLLTEAANVPGSSLSFGWTVLSFPILVDIYAEPIVSELCNVYPVSSPVASIPRIKIMAYITGYSGAVTQVRIPTMTQSVRPGALALSVTPAVANNMFTIATAAVAPATVSAALYRINRRYTLITSITSNEAPAGGGNVAHTTAVVIKPDNRNQFIGTFTYTDALGDAVVGSLSGHINYDTSVFSFNVIYSGGTGTNTCTSAILSMRFMPTNTMNGRIKVKIETEMTDVTIDPNEDFLSLN
jgi:hypothetical protein